MSSRNQKATALVTCLFILTGVLCTFGALVKPETRITGTIAGKKIDIPAWQQTEPEYDGKLKNVKVEQGWGWARFLFFLLALAPAGLAIALIGERRGEIPAERKAYEDEELEKEDLRKVRRAYKVGFATKFLKNKGEADLAIQEEELEMKVDAYRSANGIYAPEPVVAQLPPEPPLLRQPEGAGGIFDGMKTPAQYAEEIEAARLAAIDKLPENGGDVRSGDNVPDDRKSMFQQRGVKTIRSLVASKISILSAAPTGCGKTLTLYQWLGDLQRLYPDNECYVIAHKRDSFLGLLEKGRVKKFKSFSPEISLQFLDIVYAEMERRLDELEGDRHFEKKPVRLILDDWFATFDVLKKHYPELWASVSMKLGAIITTGREANVCAYIATQSPNIVSLGIQDSNIRGNLAINCQGLITEKLDEYGEIVEQGNYESIQLIIDNKFIVSSKADRERLNAELEEVIALSRLHKVPAMFSAVGGNTIALAPYYEKPIAGEDSTATNVAVIDSNSGDDGSNGDDEWTAAFNQEVARRGIADNSQSQSEQPPDSAQNNDRIGVPASEPGETETESVENKPPFDPELDGWYKWLPSKAEVIKMLEDTDGSIYNFTSFIRAKLKKTETTYHKKTKNAIVELLLNLERFDLITKYEIDTRKYPIE